MKTRNDILAEYVRSRYPEIEKTFDFAAYSAGVALNTTFGLRGSAAKITESLC